MRRLGFPFRHLAIVLATGVALSGCASYYGGYGGGSGYGGLSVGIGTGGYYDPYYGSYYGRSAYYGGGPYWGWNDGYYYPGAGYYVYDSYRRPYRWTDAQRRYWLQRRAAIGTTATTTTSPTATTRVRPNWSGFKRTGAATTMVARPDRQERIQSRIERRQSFKSGAGTSTERSRRARQPD